MRMRNQRITFTGKDVHSVVNSSSDSSRKNTVSGVSSANSKSPLVPLSRDFSANSSVNIDPNFNSEVLL